MKDILKALLATLALGTACAEVNCTTKSTTTVTVTSFYPTNETASAGSMMVTDLTSVYNGSTSVLTITGEMTNPFLSTITGPNETLYTTYDITVPVGTCTIGQECPYLNTTTADASVVATTESAVPTNTTSTSAVTEPTVTVTFDNVTLSNTETVHTTVPSSAEPPSAVSLTGAPSTVSASVTITSIVTQYSTLMATSSLIVETTPMSVESSKGADNSTLTTLPVITVTVIPLPVTGNLSVSAPRVLSATSTVPSIILPTLTAASAGRRLGVPAPLAWLTTIYKMITGVKAATPTQTSTETVASDCPPNWVCLTATTWLSATTATVKPAINGTNSTVHTLNITTATATTVFVPNVTITETATTTEVSIITDPNFNATMTWVSTSRYYVYNTHTKTETVVVTTSASGAVKDTGDWSGVSSGLVLGCSLLVVMIVFGLL